MTVIRPPPEQEQICNDMTPQAPAPAERPPQEEEEIYEPPPPFVPPSPTVHAPAAAVYEPESVPTHSPPAAHNVDSPPMEDQECANEPAEQVLLQHQATVTSTNSGGIGQPTEPDSRPAASVRNRNKPSPFWRVGAILVVVAVVVIVVLVVVNMNPEDDYDEDKFQGGATCNLAYEIPFRSAATAMDDEEAEAVKTELVIRGDSRRGGKPSSYASFPCSVISSTTPGLFYQIQLPPTSSTSSISVVRFNVTVCPTSYQNMTAASTEFRGGVKLAVFAGGSCNSYGEYFSTSSSRCLASKVVTEANLCDPAFSSLSWYANNEEGKNYLFIQPISSVATGGPFDLTIRQGVAQVGKDLEGNEFNATFGASVAVSGDGLLVVAPELTAVSGVLSKGQVRFFRRSQNNATYVENGTPLQGPADQLGFGFCVDVSNSGKTIALASDTKLYIYDVTSNLEDLNQEIRFDSAFQSAGVDLVVGSVTISGDGRTAAWNIFDEQSGIVQVFRKASNGIWSQLGSNITTGNITTGIYSTDYVYDKAVALSENGTAIAVAGPSNTAWVYEWTGGAWAIKGGRVIYDVTSVAIISDGTCVAAGKAGSDSTTVKIWCFSTDGEDTLTQVGQTLYGYDTNYGHSLSFSKGGHILAIGSPWTAESSSKTSTGKVQIYQFNFRFSRWDMHAELSTAISGDIYGWSTAVSYDASTVVIGVPLHEGNGQMNSGMVQVFKISADLECGCDG